MARWLPWSKEYGRLAVQPEEGFRAEHMEVCHLWVIWNKLKDDVPEKRLAKMLSDDPDVPVDIVDDIDSAINSLKVLV